MRVIGLRQQLNDMQTFLTRITIQHRILRQLIFEDMGARWDDILDAEPKTCRWLLEKSSNDVNWSSDIDLIRSDSYLELGRKCNTRNHFIGWLTAGESVPHVSGNAGAEYRR